MPFNRTLENNRDPGVCIYRTLRFSNKILFFQDFFFKIDTSLTGNVFVPIYCLGTSN